MRCRECAVNRESFSDFLLQRTRGKVISFFFLFFSFWWWWWWLLEPVPSLSTLYHVPWWINRGSLSLVCNVLYNVRKKRRRGGICNLIIVREWLKENFDGGFCAGFIVTETPTTATVTIATLQRTQSVAPVSIPRVYGGYYHVSPIAALLWGLIFTDLQRLGFATSRPPTPLCNRAPWN